MKKWLQEKSIPKPAFVVILVLFALAFLLNGGITILKLGIYSSVVSGSSMENTLSHGSKLISINENFKEIKRGDIISIKINTHEGKISLVKRVIGMPGETINIQGNKVYINGDLLEEPYAYYNGQCEDDLKITLQEDSYFVMGDNRLDSLDSCILGPIHRNMITRIVLFYRN